MALMEQYKDVWDLANKIGLKDPDVKEEGGKLKVRGVTAYEREKNLLWDQIKTHPNWQNEIAADIRTEKQEIYGIHTVASGETLSKLAKQYLGDARRYTDIFSANKDILTNPDLIKVGQQLKIPHA